MESLEIITAGAEDVSKYVRMVISGAPGSGKTTFATSAPNPIWAAVEPGLAPLVEGQIRYVNILNENDLFNLKVGLELGQIEAETLVVDQVDVLQTRLFDQKLKAEGRTTLKNDDWNWVDSKLRGIFSALSDLPLHVIYITGLKDVGGYDGLPLESKNNLMGNISNYIYKSVDFAVICQRVSELTPEGELVSSVRLQTRPSERYPIAFNRTWAQLDSFMDIDIFDFDEFIKARELDVWKSQERETVEVGIVEEIEDAPEKVEVPGMSSQKDISKFLKKEPKEGSQAKENKENN